MCGITGFVNNKDNKKEIIKKMADKIAHRGPDGEGYYIDETIALAHRRLAIIDLSTGNQPMYNKDKSIVIVFNGEIYNFLEIKDELKSKGYNTRKIVVDIEEDDSYAIKDITINIKREREKEEKEKEIKEEKNEIINEVKIEKIIIGKEKEESDESNATIFEKNEITKYISETYGIEENKITVY